MKRICPYAILAAAAIAVLTGCAGVNSLLKSGKPDLIYAKALEFYEKGKW